MFMIGTIFPNSGIIKECDNDYESNDDIQMFIWKRYIYRSNNHNNNLN